LKGGRKEALGKQLDQRGKQQHAARRRENGQGRERLGQVQQLRPHSPALGGAQRLASGQPSKEGGELAHLLRLGEQDVDASVHRPQHRVHQLLSQESGVVLHGEDVHHRAVVDVKLGHFCLHLPQPLGGEAKRGGQCADEGQLLR
jgi:hypothetical protein